MKREDIKTIAIDLDGTLLTKSEKILPKTKEALLKLQEEGIHVILASGRPIKSMLRFAEELKLDEYEGIIISNNGSVGYDMKNHKLLYDTPIDRDLVLEILESIEGRPIWPMIEYGDYMLVKDVYEGVVNWDGELHNITRRESRTGRFLLKEVKNYAEYIDNHVNKVLTILDPSIIEENISEYKERFGDRVHVVQTSPYFMEFINKKSNKAYGLDMLKIDKETLMTFGDSMNDREMLLHSKYPIAMGNAADKVKEAAIYITDNNENEGIYKALKYFELI